MRCLSKKKLLNLISEYKPELDKKAIKDTLMALDKIIPLELKKGNFLKIGSLQIKVHKRPAGMIKLSANRGYQYFYAHYKVTCVMSTTLRRYLNGDKRRNRVEVQ